MSVRTRIAVSVALLTALALGTSGALVFLLGEQRIQQDVPASTAQEIAELRELQTRGIDPRTNRPFTSIQRLVTVFLTRNVPSRSELMVGVWNGEVRRTSLSSRGDLALDPAFQQAVLDRVETGGATRLDTDYGEVFVEVLPLNTRRGGDPGAFAVAFFVDDLYEPLFRIMRSYALAAAIALAVITSFAAWLAGRLLEPVRTLRETADEITETDLSRRIPEVGNDDLTDLTRTFNAMLDRLERAFRGQRAFLDDAGHELRTPLTILQGHLELMEASDVEDVDRTREMLLDEVDRMSRLVDDLILLTKADRPGFLSHDRVDLAQLTESVAEKMRGLGERSWSVESVAAGSADLDEQRITQALLQLAQNAVKHTAPGGAISVGSGAVDADRVALWVRDDGPGVPDADKETIFGRFSRGLGRDTDGVGLGLSIVTAIAQAHGGTAYVTDSRPDRDPPGARFVITLPRTRKEGLWPAS